MIPYEVDPSLHNDKPAQPELDDGFSPPHPPVTSPTRDPPSEPPSDPPGDKSGF